jgi:hypothetical protein
MSPSTRSRPSVAISPMPSRPSSKLLHRSHFAPTTPRNRRNGDRNHAPAENVELPSAAPCSMFFRHRESPVSHSQAPRECAAPCETTNGFPQSGTRRSADSTPSSSPVSSIRFVGAISSPWSFYPWSGGSSASGTVPALALARFLLLLDARRAPDGCRSG